MIDARVLAWLLDPAEPAVRARTLVDLLARADADVREARAAAPERGSAARLLADADLGARGQALYRPKYGAPFHRLIALAEMGVPASHPRAGALLELCMDEFLGPAAGPLADPEVCLTGNLTRAALLMGRGDDPRVAGALDWLVATQLADGGWHCWPDKVPHGTLDAWEGLGAFAAVPPDRRPPAMRAAILRGVEFFLANGLGMRDPYAPWRRIHVPRHYYYDVLVGLELATSLGDPRDPRLAPALAWLEGKRGADGRWHIDAQHPDVAEGADYTPRDAAATRPLVVEESGASRWATLAALRVLRRVGRA
ncbi:MAG TPA: hypothetical protein VM370_09580 [Candidatus Thermoplasmatota archaeon]|nr:hypothetical protein [Candidatus Thermoplasmatota archaeon]